MTSTPQSTRFSRIAGRHVRESRPRRSRTSRRGSRPFFLSTTRSTRSTAEPKALIADFLAFEVRDLCDRRVLEDEERVGGVARMAVLIIVGDDGQCRRAPRSWRSGWRRSRTSSVARSAWPAASNVRRLRRAAGEGHLQRIGLAVILQHVLLEIVEEDDGLHLVGTDAAAGGVANVDGRRVGDERPWRERQSRQRRRRRRQARARRESENFAAKDLRVVILSRPWCIGVRPAAAL